jgi:hypothetical protein
MNPYCPECETELDLSTRTCPACRWSPMAARLATRPEPQAHEMSLTERYRGTRYDVSVQGGLSSEGHHVARGRAFVLVALVAGASLYALIVNSMGIF